MSQESERPLIPSLELPARSARERRLPTRLQDYHLGALEENDSPSSVESKTPQVAEGDTTTPELDSTTKPSIHPISPLLMEEERQDQADLLLAALIPLPTEIPSQSEHEEVELHEEDPPGGGNVQNGEEIIPPDATVPIDGTDP